VLLSTSFHGLYVCRFAASGRIMGFLLQQLPPLTASRKQKVQKAPSDLDEHRGECFSFSDKPSWFDERLARHRLDSTIPPYRHGSGAYAWPLPTPWLKLTRGTRFLVAHGPGLGSMIRSTRLGVAHCGDSGRQSKSRTYALLR